MTLSQQVFVLWACGSVVCVFTAAIGMPCMLPVGVKASDPTCAVHSNLSCKVLCIAEPHKCAKVRCAGLCRNPLLLWMGLG